MRMIRTLKIKKSLRVVLILLVVVLSCVLYYSLRHQIRYKQAIEELDQIHANYPAWVDSDHSDAAPQYVERAENYAVYMKNGMFYCDIYRADGKLVKTDGPLSRQPHIESVDGGLLRVSMQSGTGMGTRSAYYYDPVQDRFSETFQSVFDEYGGKVACCTQNAVIVRDIFDTDRFYSEITEFGKPFSAVALPFEDVRFTDEGTRIIVTYLSGEDYQLITEERDIGYAAGGEGEANRAGNGAAASTEEKRRVELQSEMIGFLQDHLDEMQSFALQMKALDDSDPDHTFLYAVKEDALYEFDGVNAKAQRKITEHPILSDSTFFRDTQVFDWVSWNHAMFDCDVCIFAGEVYDETDRLYAELYLFYSEDEPVAGEYRTVEQLAENWYFYYEFRE